MKGIWRYKLQNIFTNKIYISDWYNNLVPTCSREAMARRLCNIGAKANEGVITYLALGTGTTAPANTDTTLETEGTRKAITIANNTDNIITWNISFTAAEGNGIWTEFGLFGEDASASADSGTLFNHALCSITKTTSFTLAIEIKWTVN